MTWEYRIIQFGKPHITDYTDQEPKKLGVYEEAGKVLNLLGAAGWEYIGDTALSMGIFKRPVSQAFHDSS